MSNSHQPGSELYEKTARMLFVENKTHEEVRRFLVLSGLDRQSAEKLIDEVKGISSTSKTDRGMRNIFLGAIILAAGIAATMADFGYIFYGAILVGASQIVIGIIKTIKS